VNTHIAVEKEVLFTGLLFDFIYLFDCIDVDPLELFSVGSILVVDSTPCLLYVFNLFIFLLDEQLMQTLIKSIHLINDLGKLPLRPL